jgi:hypothetical protein
MEAAFMDAALKAAGITASPGESGAVPADPTPAAPALMGGGAAPFTGDAWEGGSLADAAGSLPGPSDLFEPPNPKGAGTGVLSHSLAAWAVNLALAGIAVGIGWLAMEGLRWGAHALGGGFAAVIEAFPVFPLAIIGSLLVRLVLERSGNASVASSAIQGLVATLAADLLITADQVVPFTSPRIDTHNTHGTGCSLSSAIAAHLAHGLSLPEAVGRSKTYISAAIKAADHLTIGHGHGPIHHFHAMWS